MTIWRNLLAVSVLCWGCSSDSGSKNDTGITADGGLTPSAVCDRYLRCVKAAKPEQYDEELKLFRADGTCWGSAASSANCEKACQSGYDDLARLHPTVAACGGTPVDGGPDRGLDLGNLEPTGNRCTADLECQGGICLKELTDDGVKLDASGGYCSRDCSTTTCQSGEACFRNTDALGKTLSQVCLRVCVNDSDCRSSEGYICHQTVCMPGTRAPDAG